jgi:hypothetical protein
MLIPFDRLCPDGTKPLGSASRQRRNFKQIGSKFVRAYMRKMLDKNKHQQLPLPIPAEAL